MSRPHTLSHFLISIALVLFAIDVSSGEAKKSHGAWQKYQDTAMTTRIELEFWYEDKEEAEAIAQKVFEVFHHVDQTMSRYIPDSELSLVNQSAFKSSVKVSSALFDVLQHAERISRLSDGAFDISFASVGYLYDFRAAVQPSDSSLSDLTSIIDYRKIRLEPVEHSVSLDDARMILDLGGIAKGYAVDQGILVLQRHGVKHARLSAGGDMRLLGDKRGQPWIVGVRDPRVKSEQAVVLPLSDVAVSTSGDYERFFIDDNGERVHHILSPKTGKPANGIQSVSIIGSNAIETDALSTAVFVLGAEDGLNLINRLPDLDAVIIDENRKMHFSEGLMSPN